IDDLNLSPTVVKIDAEGYDERILHGMENTLRRCLPILMIENNPINITRIIQYLTGFGYRILQYDHQRRRLLPYAGGATRNVFFTASDEAM
ncbi:MAG: FkbM family methyltransferase, partial [Chloroflexi bacterium]|nr:FkbM family methyltransferase [Chloroflexota bacterium]